MSELLPLLREYARLSGAALRPGEEGLLLFHPSSADAELFGSDPRVLATDPEQLELHPEAEMAVLGSRFARTLLEASRRRGTRVDLGFVPPSGGEVEGAARPEPPLRRGSVVEAEVDTRWVPVGRLHAAASVRTGHHVEDHLAVTGWFDLRDGRPVAMELAGIVLDRDGGDHPREPVAATGPLVTRMLETLEGDLQARVGERVEQAEHRLGVELRRLDGYYQRLVQEVRLDADPAVREAYKADHRRRRAEEIARHRASAELRPLQLEVVHLLAEVARLTIQDGAVRGTLTARRYRAGDTRWRVTCPACLTPDPTEVALCSEGHPVCSECAPACTVCGSTSCADHEGGRCRTGGHGLCSEHARLCPSCAGAYCAKHRARCEAGGHDLCLECAVLCAVCGSHACPRHATRTHPPEGEESRLICLDCVRYCRDLPGEPRGRDEVAGCGLCGRDVCGEHSATCEVDGAVVCASHTVRSDRTRRVICEEHRATCDHEPGVLFASDEVTECVRCGRHACGDHGAACYRDGAWFCREHLVQLPRGDWACEEHVRTCVVDDVPGRISEIDRCPVCSHGVCERHREACGECGRVVCSRDLERGACRSCRSRSAVEPEDALLNAFARIHDERWGRPRGWAEARDATHRVVEVKLGRWGRRVVFCHDDQTGRVTHAILHGLLSTERIRG